jgi:hypothetical protein
VLPAKKEFWVLKGSFAQERRPARKTPPGSRADYTPTPDRRYFVVRGRLWRLSNPFLDPDTHERLVRDLMNARYAIARATDKNDRISARLRADAAKRALGERGDVWWNDGAPDYNRKLAMHTPYAAWFNGAEDRDGDGQR